MSPRSARRARRGSARAVLVFRDVTESRRAEEVQAESGVIDRIERKVRTVSVDYMRQWREVIDEQWLQDLLDIMRDQFANFDEVYKALKEGKKSST